MLEARKKGYGFFVLFTNHQGLSAERLIKIYKSRDIVEQGFRALKSDLEIDPVYHSRDDRIETHTVMVVFGIDTSQKAIEILKNSISDPCTKEELEEDFQFLSIKELYEHRYDEPRAHGETHHHISWTLIASLYQ